MRGMVIFPSPPLLRGWFCQARWEKVLRVKVCCFVGRGVRSRAEGVVKLSTTFTHKAHTQTHTHTSSLRFGLFNPMLALFRSNWSFLMVSYRPWQPPPSLVKKTSKHYVRESPHLSMLIPTTSVLIFLNSSLRSEKAVISVFQYDRGRVKWIRS